MTLLDIWVWITSHLRPVVVTVPAPDDGPGWLDYAPLATVLVAAVGVGIAGLALRASRRSANNSAASVDRADAALRGAVRPILTCERDGTEGKFHMRIENVGPGVAVSVFAVCASVLSPRPEDEEVMPWGWATTPDDVGPLGPGASVTVTPTWVSGHQGTGTTFEVLLVSLDVNGNPHWTHRWLGAGFRSEVGEGDLPDRLEAFTKYLHVDEDEPQEPQDS